VHQNKKKKKQPVAYRSTTKKPVSLDKKCPFVLVVFMDWIGDCYLAVMAGERGLVL